MLTVKDTVTETLGTETSPTVFPPSLSRGTTWIVIPREEASQAGPNSSRVRPCNRVLSLDLCSISSSSVRLDVGTCGRYGDRDLSSQDSI